MGAGGLAGGLKAMPWGPVHWSADYVKDPTMVELESHVTDGLDFVAGNPATVRGNFNVVVDRLPPHF